MADLIIKIGAKSKEFEDELDKIKGQTKSLEKQLASIAKISGLAFAGLTAGVGFAVKAFAKFDNSMRGVKTLLDETSFGAQGLEKGFAQMQKSALELGKNIPVDLDKVSKALFDTVSAGVDASKAVEFVGSAAKLAVAGLTDVGVATDGMTSALNAYGLGAEEAESIAGKFFTAQKFGKTTIDELSGSLGLVVSSAASFGVSLDELLASTAAATAGGIRTNAAMTGLQAALANVAKPTAEARAEAALLGVEFNATALRSQGLEGFLKSLTSAQGFTKDSVTALFGSVEAQKLIFALTGQQADKFSETLKELGNETKVAETFSKAFEVQSASLSNEFVKLKTGLQVVLIQIGSEFAPIVTRAAKAASEFIKSITADKELTSLIAKIAGVGIVLTGLVTVLATSALAFLKLRSIMILTAKTFPILSKGAKLFRLTLGLGTKATILFGKSLLFIGKVPFRLFNKALLLSIGRIPLVARAMSFLRASTLKATLAMKGLGLSVKGLVAATGIGLLILVIADLALNFDVRMKQIQSIFKRAADNIGKIASGLGNLLAGAFSFDLDLVTKGFDQLKDALSNTFDDIKEDFGKISAGEEIQFLPPEEVIKAEVETKGEVVKEAQKQNDDALTQQFRETRKKQLEDQKKADKEEKNAAKKSADQAKKEKLASFKAGTQALRLITEGATAEEIDFKKKEGALLASIEEERNVERRELLTEQLEQLREIRIEDAAVESERREILSEEVLLQNEEFQSLTADQQTAFIATNQVQLLAAVQTEQMIKDESLKRDIIRDIRRRKQFLVDEQKFGTEQAQVKQFLRSEELQSQKRAFGDLAALQSSENATLKSIGKAAAIANITIRTAEGAINAYNAFSFIPLVGPFLGFAAAGAIIAFGAEQISRVSSAQAGGVVGGSGRGDSQPFLLEPGELITPRSNFDEVIQAVGSQRLENDLAAADPLDEGETEASEGEPIEIMLGFDGDEAENVITARQNEARALGVSEEIA